MTASACSLVVARRTCHPLAKRQCAANGLAQDVAAVEATQNRNGPLLPVTVPVQWNWHRAEPRAQQTSDQTAVCLVQRRSRAGDGRPCAGLDTVDVEEWEEREEGDVGGAQEGVRDVCEEGSAEENEHDVQGGRDQSGEEDGEEDSLA